MHDGKTPLDLVREPEHIRLLLKFGAIPNESNIRRFFPKHFQNDPADMAVKMFVLGNPGAGKSTLVKSLQTEGARFSRIKHRFSKVTDVDERTAGIIPYDIESKALGRDRFRDVPAVQLNVAKQIMIYCADIKQYIYAEHYMYLNCVISSNLFEVCEMLNKRGDILFMKNSQQPESSWIVFDKAVLLSRVNGVIFAPEGFKEHQKSLSTSTGVVPLSKLAPLFPNINSDMIAQFLCHLEFCQEIKELKLASLLVAEGQSTPTAGERYFFFPGLVHLDTPRDVIESGASKLDYNSGWVLQCSKPEQFFSSRFLQVLVLRLAFLFALAPTDPSTGDHLALHRKCSVWKNGIYWVNRSGGEAIVEVNNLRQVVVIVRSELKKMELVRLRSAVIKTIISAKEEFCSKVLVRESLILPEDAAVYPLDSSKVTGVSITEVAATIAEGKEFVINDKNKKVELEKLICFEPHAYLGEALLQQLFSKDATEAQEITDKLLTDIATKCSRKSTDKYCVIFEQEIDACASHEGVRGLSQVFQLWRDRMGKEGTRKNFRKKLDQFSVFAGRNPLELITRKYC